jgi:hypothetical protein
MCRLSGNAETAAESLSVLKRLTLAQLVPIQRLTLKYGPNHTNLFFFSTRFSLFAVYPRFLHAASNSL